MPAITVRTCTTRVAARKKFYDDRCPGFYVSVTPNGVATFYFKFWNGEKQALVKIGIYHATELTVEQARAEAFALKGRAGKGVDVAHAARVAKAQQIKLSGKTVAEIKAEYVAWIKTPVKKPDGVMRPRVETWADREAILDRYIVARHGKMVGNEITNDHIATLQADIVAGKFGKPSVANARNMRSCTSPMFVWAAEAGRRYVTTSPFANLPALDKEHKRTRRLSPAEIKKLWWGLDHPDLPATRQIALGLKLELVTMLRSKEFMTGEPSELHDLGTPDARFVIPLRRVKKRRDIVCPLSDLAQEIIAEAIKDRDQPYILPSRIDGQPLSEKVLAQALRTKTDSKGKVTRLGIRDFLGMAHFTPHDLRRTCASLAGSLKFTKANIALCLDHKDTSEDGADDVTDIYDIDGRVEEKRELLNAVANRIREIVA